MAEARYGDDVAEASGPARRLETDKEELAALYLDLAQVWRKDASAQNDTNRAVDRQMADGIARTNRILIYLLLFMIVAAIGFVWTY
jgi:hypothetical protein